MGMMFKIMAVASNERKRYSDGSKMSKVRFSRWAQTIFRSGRLGGNDIQIFKMGACR
jgi:hypothetical protein